MTPVEKMDHEVICHGENCTETPAKQLEGERIHKWPKNNYQIKKRQLLTLEKHNVIQKIYPKTKHI